MSRFSRINTIWRKELVDTLRDRRTLIAMILVPIVLYPAMILGSLQGFELQISRIQQEEHRVVVQTDEVRAWLRNLIDTDVNRRAAASSAPAVAEERVALDERGELPAEPEITSPADDRSPLDDAERAARRHPPEFVIDVIPDEQLLWNAVALGQAAAGVLLRDDFPSSEGAGSATAVLLFDETEIRSRIATGALHDILQRAGQEMLGRRLARQRLEPTFVKPIEVIQKTTATPEKVGGSILGQIVPLILIIMTITGAIYPAIDLTAGERERGTLETLMVAPVPTVDLIAGKFVVVALVGMLSAALNLLSIGGTIYLGGLGDILSRGGEVIIPLGSLPWVLLLLIPLAVMFSALLLAVCSFARSFKEAQNYVMPVMVAALIPAVVGILPGTRLEGPLLIMPVTNITILTRDLFTGKFDATAIIWVTVSTTLYAGAAVAIAARLFGQEAVLFADSGSFKTLLRRKFFKPADAPTAAQAFLLLAVVFSANFFAQHTLLPTPGTPAFWIAFAVILVALFLLAPLGLAAYLRVRFRSAFSLSRPPGQGLVAAACFGLSTWILAEVWLAFQQTWLPVPQEYEVVSAMMGDVSPLVAVVVFALLPAICEEFFFRGYALSGLRSGLGAGGALLITALAFGIHHHSIHRLIISAGLGLLLGLLVIRYRSLWPAVLAHFLHNAITVLSVQDPGLKPWLEQVGCVTGDNGLPPIPWIIGAAVLSTIGLLLCLFAPARETALERFARIRQTGGIPQAGEP